jgi:magnesium-transporting ATPase (P-type)
MHSFSENFICNIYVSLSLRTHPWNNFASHHIITFYHHYHHHHGHHNNHHYYHSHNFHHVNTTTTTIIRFVSFILSYIIWSSRISAHINTIASPNKISPSKTFKQIPPGSSPHTAPYYESSQNVWLILTSIGCILCVQSVYCDRWKKWTDRWMDGYAWIDGWIRWMDGLMDRQIDG